MRERNRRHRGGKKKHRVADITHGGFAIAGLAFPSLAAAISPTHQSAVRFSLLFDLVPCVFMPLPVECRVLCISRCQLTPAGDTSVRKVSRNNTLLVVCAKKDRTKETSYSTQPSNTKTRRQRSRHFNSLPTTK
jgi:hypothetical protein